MNIFLNWERTYTSSQSYGDPPFFICKENVSKELKYGEVPVKMCRGREGQMGECVSNKKKRKMW